MPIGLALLFLMAVAPVLPWRKASTETLAAGCTGRRGSAPAALVLAVARSAPAASPRCSPSASAASRPAPPLRQVVLATRRQGWRGLVGRTNGGMIVHLGVVLIAVGLAASSSYATEREVTLTEGEVGTVAGHTLELVGTEVDVTPARTESRALIRSTAGRSTPPPSSEFPEGTQTIGTPSVRTDAVRGRVPVAAARRRPRRRRRERPRDRVAAGRLAVGRAGS